HLDKIPQFFDDHWDQALRYLRKKGMGKHRRGSNSESGMRLLRRLEKNHDGIRSAATRQHYIQIYQAIKYLSLAIAEFIEQGPQMPGLLRVYNVRHTPIMLQFKINREFNHENGCNCTPKTGLYDPAYLMRALITALGLGADRPQDAVYPTALKPADGEAYD